jgi:flagellar basal-body rod modification protein FlgD
MSSPISFVPAPATGTTTSAGSDLSSASLASNFDTFLNILTAQIQNQDPLEPMDSTQFTQQLVQFSGVEQQIRSNKQLETLISLTQNTAGAALSGYLGNTAQVASASAGFSGEPLEWTYGLARDASTATLRITNARGNVVYSQAVERTGGAHSFTWDGRMTDGSVAPEGAYTVRVEATDANGAPVTTSANVMTLVTGVDLSYGEPALTTEAGVFAFSDILRMTRH